MQGRHLMHWACCTYLQRVELLLERRAEAAHEPRRRSPKPSLLCKQTEHDKSGSRQIGLGAEDRARRMEATKAASLKIRRKGSTRPYNSMHATELPLQVDLDSYRTPTTLHSHRMCVVWSVGHLPLWMRASVRQPAPVAPSQPPRALIHIAPAWLP